MASRRHRGLRMAQGLGLTIKRKPKSTKPKRKRKPSNPPQISKETYDEWVHLFNESASKRRAKRSS